MSKAVGVTIDDKVEWHAPGVGGSDHDTLCGIDANDPAIGHTGVVSATRGQKIDCEQCRAIWQDVMALKLRRRDFS
jgi:hypothetical protein